jgi:hypothetical protein
MPYDCRGADKADVIASRPRNKSIALEPYKAIERGTGHHPWPHQQGESGRNGTHQTYPTAIATITKHKATKRMPAGSGIERNPDPDQDDEDDENQATDIHNHVSMGDGPTPSG